MNNLDLIILVTVKLLGLVVCILSLVGAITWLAWWLYSQYVGWPVILAALKAHKARQAQGEQSGSSPAE